MKVICLKENLKKGVAVVEKIIGRNQNFPILNNILIETNKNLFTLSSTDLEIGISCDILAKTIKEGKICVPSRVLSDLVSILPGEKIELDSQETVLKIKSENYNTALKGFGPEDFPIIPEIKSDLQFGIDTSVLTQGLASVVGMVSPAGFKPEISGILFDFNKNRLDLVATDSFRLARKTISLENESLLKPFILPAKTAQEIIRIFGAEEGEIKTVLTKNQVLFDLKGSPSSPGVRLVSRLIEGEYPNYQVIIPQKSQQEAMVFKNNFLDQIRVAGLFSGRTADVKVKFDYKNQKIKVSSKDAEFGENESEVEAQIQPEDSEETSFNYRYLLDGLNNIDDEEIVFGLNGFRESGAEVLLSRPATLKPKNRQDYIYIVMPIGTT